MSSSELRFSETGYVPSAVPSTVCSAEAEVVTQKEKMIEQIAKITIENLGALFIVAAMNANEMRSLFHLCAEAHRQNFLAQAAKIRDNQNGVLGKGALGHAANVVGAAASGFAGQDGSRLKAAGGAVSAAGGFLSSSQSAESTYDSARQSEISQMMQSAFGDVSRAQKQAEDCLQMLAGVYSAMQQAKAGMMR